MKALRKPVVALRRRPAAPRQLAMAFEAPQLWVMEETERRKIIVCLANLLTQAAGEAAEEESSNDER